MRRSILTLMALCASLFLFPACGDDAEDRIDENVETLSANDQWQSSCQDVNLDVFGLSAATEFYDIGEGLRRTTRLYSDDRCTTAIVEIEEAGTYEIGAEVTAGAHAFDRSFTSVRVTPLTEAGAMALNAVNACGFNAWAAGQDRDVTAATSDDPVTDRCWFKTPRTQYDLIDVSGDELRTGLATDELDMTAPNRRPARLNRDVVFSRQ